ILGTSGVEEVLAPTGLGRLVGRAMEDQYRQSHLWELFFKAFVGANHFGKSFRGLRFVGDQRVVVHELDNFRISRKDLVFEMQNMSMGRQVTHTFEDRQSKIRSRDFMSETLAD